MEICVEQIAIYSYGRPLFEAGGCALKEADNHEEEHTLEQRKGVRGAVAEGSCYGLITTPPSISLVQLKAGEVEESSMKE